jgi:hypothetical protein
MTFRVALLLIAVVAFQAASAQSATMTVPESITAGDAFSIQSTGSGNAVLYIVGLGQVVRRDVRLGEAVKFPAGTLYNVGRYLVVLATATGSESRAFDVVPAGRPVALSFLAKPSRLPVGLHNGITGAVYVFDAYQNLITQPTSVLFELSTGLGTAQTRKVVTRDGAGWTAMDSSSREGAARFVARIDDVSSTRVIQQVPGDPCGLKVSARQAGPNLVVETDPVRDCSGNPVSDGTIVTFTENYNGGQSTVDVPLKRGVALVEMPAYSGARISVASGVVMGNEIRWGGR